MKFTLKPVLWAKDIDKEGNCPIAISIAGGGNRTYYQTGLKCKKNQWDKGKVKKGGENYDLKNTRIENMIADANREILNQQMQGVTVTFEMIKKMFNPDKPLRGGFIKFYSEFIDLLASRHSEGYIRHYKSQFEQFKDFVKGSIAFSEITAEKLEEFEMSLTVADTTKHTKMKRLKEVIRRAIDRGHMTSKQIAGYKFPSYTEPETFYLTLAQTEKIAEKVYSGEYDSDYQLKKVACYFLVECYGGIRFSDWRTFEVEKLIKNRNFKVRTQKNKQPIYLDLDVFKSLDAILSYIERNGIIFDITEPATNRILKDIGRQLKLKFALTTHVGRRTFGTLLGELGYSTRFIADAMGITENTAKRYVKHTRQSMNNEMKEKGGF